MASAQDVIIRTKTGCKSRAAAAKAASAPSLTPCLTSHKTAAGFDVKNDFPSFELGSQVFRSSFSAHKRDGRRVGNVFLNQPSSLLP
jgi:hypothetical protein